LWNETQYSLVYIYQCFRVFCHERGGRRFLRNVGTYLQTYMESLLRKESSSCQVYRQQFWMQFPFFMRSICFDHFFGGGGRLIFLSIKCFPLIISNIL
jgi:hypothetical protein